MKLQSQISLNKKSKSLENLLNFQRHDSRKALFNQMASRLSARDTSQTKSTFIDKCLIQTSMDQTAAYHSNVY